MEFKRPRLVAEIGCNHKGEMDTARDLIKIAGSYCKVDVVKFQKRNVKELLTEEQYNAPHPNPANAYGNSYGEHREFLELNLAQHQQLKKWCEEEGLIYSTSVWDLTSAKEIASLQPDMIKIPSACNIHYEMLNWLADHYHGEIHVSFGMTTQEEEKKIVKLFEKKNRNKDLVIYCCTSGYPISYDEVCLLEIKRLQQLYGNIVKEIGFSGHHLGTAIDISAYTLGATIIERHYTLDRTWKGTDHTASLEPDVLRKLKQDLDAAYQSLQYKEEEILAIEKVQRDKLKYRKR
ncbi:N-acetylneuraminate synthase family protein [Gracilibacillus xinjiangensis]|uniref:N-acetylneuraminate synthase family protein n=1 Tax=Gracilibacillus xinjiangensis TaxID=1193282 RepID=A0ABV8WWR6_9BACI